MDDFAIKMDISDMIQWLNAWKAFPRESGKWAAKMINNMAFEFRSLFPKVLAAHRYIIRDPAFIGNEVKIDRARPHSHMADIFATVGTWHGTSHDAAFDARSVSAGVGANSHRFSGFEEEITRSLSTVARPHWRVITNAGRKGRMWQGISLPHARMYPNQRIPSIIDTDAGLQRVPEESRFGAMIRMMAEGKIAHSPSNTFILEEGKYKPGLYRSLRAGNSRQKTHFTKAKRGGNAPAFQGRAGLAAPVGLAGRNV
jgi:hypothetical protein